MKLVFSAAVAALLAIPAFASDGVRIDDPYVRALGASARSGAVFMVIENNSDSPDRLIAAETDVAAHAEMHTHKADAKGMMQMLEVEGGFPIEPHGTRALARGGDHVMLFDLQRSLAEGEMVTIVLTFEHAGKVTIQAPVDNKRMPGQPGMGAMAPGN